MDANITVVGGANIDVCTKSKAKIIDFDSNAGEIEFALGGVGRNIAECLSIFGANVSLLTAIGNDSFGSVVSDNAKEQGIKLIEDPFKGEKTGVYVNINDSDGSFIVGINDMEISSKLTASVVCRHLDTLSFSDYVVIEANLLPETIKELISHNYILIADCVSTLKCNRLEPFLDKIWLLKANLWEARTLVKNMDYSEKQCVKVLVEKGLKQGIISLGKNGATAFRKNEKDIEFYRVSNLPGEKPEKNSNGCGDALLSGFIMGIIRGKSFKDSLILGQAAAYLNSKSFSSVNKDMNFSSLKEAAEVFKKNAQIKEEILNL